MPLFDAETDMSDPDGKIRCRAYGSIEVENGKFKRIRFRPWPKIISSLEISTWGNRIHGNSRRRDHCVLFYNQPFFHQNYLALKYIVSYHGTSFRSCRLAARLLDEVARLKGSDAIVCEVSNLRISDRLLQRLGWEEHLPDRSGRHFIKRFYGKYPEAIVSKKQVETSTNH